MNNISVSAIKTDIFKSGQNLVDFIVQNVRADLIKENMVLAITSKLVSIAEGCLVSAHVDKSQLIKEQCDIYLGPIGYGSHLTVTQGLMIVSAGIDESNSESADYIVYPENPFESAQKLHQALSERWQLKSWGLILTDSCTRPLRRGVQGVCLAHWGFNPVLNKIGDKDLFGRELKMTQVHLADSMASICVMLMGEASEQSPLAIIEGLKLDWSTTCDASQLSYSYEDDMYHPLLESLREKN